MKYLSVLFFGAAMAWTWGAIHSRVEVNSQTHSGIQSAMAQLVRATLLAKRPNAQNFLIQKMRTEERENGEVRVHFQYAYSEADSEGHPVSNQISGVATLSRSPNPSETGQEQWTLKKVQATNDVIAFERGLVITPGVEPEGPGNSSAPKDGTENPSEPQTK